MLRLKIRPVNCFLILITLISYSPSVFCEWKPYLELKNDCGLNDGADPTSIEDCEAADLQNVVFTTGGAITKRSGFANINSTALTATTGFTNLGFFRTSTGTRFLVASTVDGSTRKLWDMPYGAGTSGPTGTWADITGSVTVNYGINNHGSVSVGQDTLVFTDGQGTNPPYKWTGSGNFAALGGSPPNAAWCEYHKTIEWCAGDTSNPSTLSFSNVGDINTWTATDTLKIETSNGESIQGLKSALDCLYVFKDFSIWRVCGTDRDSFTVEQMVRGIGTLSHNSIQLINNQFVFFTSQGQVAVYDGGVNIQIISAPIQVTLNGLVQSRLAQAVSSAIQDATGNVNYYLSVSNSAAATNNLMLVYDTTHKAWLKFVGLNANAMTGYEIGTNQKNLAFGDYVGKAQQYPSGASDAGSAISAYYITKQYSFPDVPQDKDWRVLETFLTQTGAYTMTITTRADFESPGTSTTVSLNGTGAVWDTAVWDTDAYADVTTTISRIEVEKNRRFFQTKFSDNSTNPAWTVKGFLMWIEPRNRV